MDNFSLQDTPSATAGLSLANRWSNFLESLQQYGIEKLGIGQLLDYASQTPRELGYMDDAGGSGDALRHLLLAAELRRTHPQLANGLLYGHELLGLMRGQPIDQMQMDIANNNIGLRLGQLSNSPQQSLELAKSHLPVARQLNYQTQFPVIQRPTNFFPNSQ